VVVVMSCCDDYGNCNQGRDCPVRVAKVGQRLHGPELLPPNMWRYQLKRLAYWMLMAVVIGLTVWPALAYLILRLS
jgi:hypothetical protein